MKAITREKLITLYKGFVICLCCVIILMFVGLMFSVAHSQERADVCMAIGLDVSGSINSEEFQLQRDGTAEALSNPEFLNAVRAGRHGVIAVSVYYWSDSVPLVEVAVPWTPISDNGGALLASQLLRATQPRLGVKSTSLATAITAGTEILRNCPWFADRQLLNIAGDGATNIGPSPLAARNYAIDLGIIINGIVISEDILTIRHYESEVVGPEHIGFYIQIGDMREFMRAMLNKFLLEIAFASPSID